MDRGKGHVTADTGIVNCCVGTIYGGDDKCATRADSGEQ